MQTRFQIRLEKERHTFSAAHFITFSGNICERLHGHNYRVAAEIDGPLDENHYVVDFIAVRDTLSVITGDLDHHMLLPSEHPSIHVLANDREFEVTFDDRRWIFPRGDCVLLPIENTTAELLAQYIATRLWDELTHSLGVSPHRLRISVDENEGQWGSCELFETDAL